MHRLIQRLRAAIGLRQSKAGRRQHAKAAGQHRGHIRQKIAKQVVGDDHVKLLGPATQLHRARISIHVRQLHIRIVLVMDFLHHFAPQDAGFHHVGLLHRADLVAPLARQFKRRTRHPGNLGFGVALRIDPDPLVSFNKNTARLAKVDARRQFANDHDVQPGHHFPLQRREIGKRVKALRRAEVGKQIHFLAQPQQTAFRLHAEIQRVVFRSTHSTQQNSVRRLRLCHRVVMQRRAVLVISTAADQILGDIKGYAALCVKPADDLLHFGHHFRTDAVTGEDKNGRIGHDMLQDAVAVD